MQPHVVQITMTVTIIAPSAPVAGQAVNKAVAKALQANPSPLLSGAQFQLIAFEKPAKSG